MKVNNVNSNIDESHNVNSNIDESHNVTRNIDESRNENSNIDESHNVNSNIDESHNVNSNIDESHNVNSRLIHTCMLTTTPQVHTYIHTCRLIVQFNKLIIINKPSFIRRLFKEVLPKKINLYERNFKNFNEREFDEALKNCDWDSILAFDQYDPNLSMEYLYNNIIFLLDEFGSIMKY